jgi:hypothetical protein
VTQLGWQQEVSTTAASADEEADPLKHRAVL